MLEYLTNLVVATILVVWCGYLGRHWYNRLRRAFRPVERR